MSKEGHFDKSHSQEHSFILLVLLLNRFCSPLAVVFTNRTTVDASQRKKPTRKIRSKKVLARKLFCFIYDICIYIICTIFNRINTFFPSIFYSILFVRYFRSQSTKIHIQINQMFTFTPFQMQDAHGAGEDEQRISSSI